jgi:hypothetical protein
VERRRVRQLGFVGYLVVLAVASVLLWILVGVRLISLVT